MLTDDMALRRRQPTRDRSPKGTKEVGGSEETQRKWGLVSEKKGSVSPALILDRDWHEHRIYHPLYIHRDAEILRQKQKVYIFIRVWVWDGQCLSLQKKDEERAAAEEARKK
jgi:hypothetical protein